MKTLCVSCAQFQSHKPTAIGAGGNSECLRTPGYYRSPVMDACKFYEKKGKKKVAKKKSPEKEETCTNCYKPYGETGDFSLPNRKGHVCQTCYLKLHTLPIYQECDPNAPCTNCSLPYGNNGRYTLPNLEGKVCFACYQVLCSNPLYLVNNRDKKCGRCEGPLGDHTKAVAGYRRLLCTKCGEETAEEHFTCVNCECHTQGKANYRKGSKKPLCAECYEYLEKTMSNKPAEVKSCTNCNHFTVDKGYCGTFGKTNRTPQTCDRFYPKEIPCCPELQVGQPKSPVVEAPKRVVCVNCGRKFKTTLAVKGGAEPVCFSCRKKDKKLCSACGTYEAKGLTDSKGNSVCYYCHNREMPVTETPIHERYLIVEGRGAWACSNVYTHDFSNRESAFKFVERYRPDTCKMFRVSSTAPIMLEELSLGYDVKVVSTHEMKEPK